jgi:VanZ family protein
MLPNTDQSSRISTRPGRGTFALAALAFTALAIYGSLVPLRYEPLSWNDAIARFRQIPYLQLDAGSRADWVSNILLFVPLGYLVAGALSVDTRSRAWRALACMVVVIAASLLSIALEFTQLWFPDRTVSQNDIIAETWGAIGGALLWFVTGQATTAWIRRYTAAARSRQQRDWLLEAYFAGFVVYAVLPLDLTISSGELLGKFREGKVTIVPFADVNASWESLYGLVRDVAVFVPIGMLIATWRAPAGRAVRPVAVTALIGAVVAVAIEFAQLLVLSRFTSSTDCILGTIGTAIGGGLMARWHRRRQPAGAVVAPNVAFRQFLVWIGAAAICAVVIAVIACAPFEVSGTRDEWRARYEGFWAVPFANLSRGSEYNAVSDILRKTLLFGLFGGCCARALTALALPSRVRWLLAGGALVAAAGLAGAIELAQVFLPPHVPDVTDVILGAVGALAGMLVVLRMTAGAKASSTLSPPARR